MANHASPEVRAFFHAFERASASLDLDAIATRFADVFMSADPSGVTVVPRPAFLGALPERQKLFDAIGARAPRLTELNERRLDDSYLLVDTQWTAELDTRTGRHDTMSLSSSFILRRHADSLNIVFYLNHQDIHSLAMAATADHAV